MSWTSAWSEEIPPHSYALLRIAFGLLGLASVFGLTPVDLFWSLDGLAPLSSDGVGPRAWLQAHGWGLPLGWVLFLGMIGIFAAMTVGFRSNAAVLGGFIGLVVQNHWNRYPLSSAHQVMIVLMFCLAWADSGRVWSLDEFLKRTGSDNQRVAAWPLMLMRCQIALIYGSTAMYKLAFPVWRDGSAVHWALSLNTFHRFPWTIPAEAAPLLALATWGTLLFEMLFPVLVFFKRTRTAILLAGVGLHLGLALTLELGPFSADILAGYMAFLDPWRTPTIFRRLAWTAPNPQRVNK